ncbi:MAG TPA: hypothetical protein VJN70_09760, partial [Gemmatimonadaceae bacterium]|nr:hypothetical protein [Gemmatimonadaceae bacterium]
MRYPLVCLLAISLGATDTRAQESVGLPAQPVFSMGQPPQWQPYASLSWLKARSDAGANAVAGIYRPILNPISGVLGASAEAALQRSGDATLGSLRIQARTPALGIGAGLDWQDAHGVAPILSFQTAVRRGGLVGSGTMLRLDWLPGSRRTFAVGVNVPLFQPFAGRTRPRQTSASLPARTAETIGQARVPLSDSTERALATVAQAASLIRVYTNLYSRDDEQVLTTSKAGEGTFDAVMRRYDAALRRSFALAVGDTDNTHGNQIAERARRGAVEKVILPYNALFGQLKDGCRVDGLVANARTDFARWIRDSVSLSPAQQSRVNTVYGRWLDVLRGQCREILHQWQDSRLVWLPLQLALASDDYDSQEQVDSLLAGAVGHAFTDHNALRYLRTADLPLEIARSIIAARSYHVLWTHDFTGRRDTGALDEIAYTMVADAYLPALTAAVSRYDSTGTLPRYIIFLDAFYYHGRDGALWMSILENPLAATVRLKSSEATQAAHLRTRLADLRAAVTRSRRLQREAATQGGEKWLRKVVRVAVNVTLPSDFSFRSRHIIPTLPFTADNVMRDHRKLVFYDVTEAAPYVGALLIAGIGIGEHYSSTTWEDRGYEVRGPAALEARAAARQVLESNGARLDQPPSPLRATPFETTTDELLS